VDILGEIATGIGIGQKAYQIYKRYRDRLDIVYSFGNRVYVLFTRTGDDLFRMSTTITYYIRIGETAAPVMLRASMLAASDEINGISLSTICLTPYFEHNSFQDVVRQQWLREIIASDGTTEDQRSWQLLRTSR
jgi:hypothetical protein